MYMNSTMNLESIIGYLQSVELDSIDKLRYYFGSLPDSNMKIDAVPGISIEDVNGLTSDDFELLTLWLYRNHVASA